MICQLCNTEFKSEKGLHIHISKTHKFLISVYYVLHFPRFDLLTKEPIIFKDTEDYFQRDFNTKENFALWCQTHKLEEVQKYIVQAFKDRAARKENQFVQSQVELKSLFLPSWYGLERIFGNIKSVINALSELKFKYDYLDQPVFSDIKPQILIDTREQNPLPFPDAQKTKLTCGDYTTSGELYSDIFVERKSLYDLAGTLAKKDRFVNEIIRAKELGYYLVVVVEDTYENTLNLTPSNGFSKKINGKFLFYQIREIMNRYDNIQFLFAGSREKAVELIPRVFQLKGNVKRFDLEYLKDFKIL